MGGMWRNLVKRGELVRGYMADKRLSNWDKSDSLISGMSRLGWLALESLYFGRPLFLPIKAVTASSCKSVKWSTTGGDIPSSTLGRSIIAVDGLAGAPSPCIRVFVSILTFPSNCSQWSTHSPEQPNFEHWSHGRFPLHFLWKSRHSEQVEVSLCHRLRRFRGRAWPCPLSLWLCICLFASILTFPSLSSEGSTHGLLDFLHDLHGRSPLHFLCEVRHAAQVQVSLCHRLRRFLGLARPCCISLWLCSIRTRNWTLTATMNHGKQNPFRTPRRIEAVEVLTEKGYFPWWRTVVLWQKEVLNSKYSKQLRGGGNARRERWWVSEWVSKKWPLWVCEALIGRLVM